MKRFLVLTVIILAMAGLCGASVIPGAPVVTSIGGGQYKWEYAVALSVDQTFRNLTTGDTLVIVDIGQYVSASWVGSAITGQLSTASAQVTATLSKTTLTLPSGVTDSTSLYDVVVQNTGSAVVGTSGVLLGTLDIISRTNIAVPANTGAFTAQAEQSANGLTTFNQGYLNIPFNTPEPTSLVLVGSALLGAGFWRRRKS